MDEPVWAQEFAPNGEFFFFFFFFNGIVSSSGLSLTESCAVQ